MVGGLVTHAPVLAELLRCAFSSVTDDVELTCHFNPSTALSQPSRASKKSPRKTENAQLFVGSNGEVSTVAVACHHTSHMPWGQPFGMRK
jgi:hypothetical protein